MFLVHQLTSRGKGRNRRLTRAADRMNAGRKYNPGLSLLNPLETRVGFILSLIRANQSRASSGLDETPPCRGVTLGTLGRTSANEDDDPCPPLLWQDLTLADGTQGYPLSTNHVDLRDTEITQSGNLGSFARRENPVDVTRSVW